MEKLLDNAPCGFLSLTDSGEIVEINSTLLKALGFDLEYLRNGHVKKLFSTAGNIFYQTHFFPLLKLQGKLEEVYLELRCSSSEEIPVLVNAARRENEGQVFYDFVLVPIRNRNVYEEEILRAKNEAETANRTKGEFLSLVSHDLRTPLSAILGWTVILKGKEEDAGLVKKALAVITRSAKSQQALIEDILDLARITSGKLQLEISRVNLTGIIKNAVEMVTSDAETKEIRLPTNLASDIFVPGDDARLQQVLWNLLSNAIKFTPKNGEVTVTLKRMGPLAEITVSDTGKGISADFLPSVFDRFQQQDNSKTQQYSGLGLGLAITRHIVELHGGAIRAESAGENMGATFRVSLPASN